ncbi:MAG TPA: hypothetical protein VLK83_01265 [Rhodanobacteraceae bacterium]|nr:hypothetical protein [Rhodanobacteraceae bacterium]
MLWQPLLAQDSKPSLADLAQQEQVRRKAIKGSSKVYSDKDLKVSAAPAPPPNAVNASVVPNTPAVVASPPPTEEPREEHDQSWWGGRMSAAREDVRRNESFAEALQSRINALTTDFTNRDDPYQRAKIGDDRQKALAELNRLTREIEKGKKAIADIEEDARTSGVPPGWIR